MYLLITTHTHTQHFSISNVEYDLLQELIKNVEKDEYTE